MRIVLMAGMLWAGAAMAAPPPSNPNPDLSPSEVVSLQLDALREVDRPVTDAGFATVFRFASPENQAQTGPLPRFARMIREGYGELINHRSARLLATIQQGEEALQPVEVTSRAGRVIRYVFLLRRIDEGPFAGCWMTDGVVQPADAGQSSET